MTTNIKIALLITALVVAGGIGYTVFTVLHSDNTVPVADVADTSAPENSPLVLQGTVTGVDAVKMRISLNASTTNQFKTANITPSTKIEKVISQKNAKGVVEKQALIEVNIDDVQKGDLVTVSYESEKDNVLDGVMTVVFTVDGNVDAYFTQVAESQAGYPVAYIKGQVIAVDVDGKILQYKPFFFNTPGTTTMSVAIPAGISVYRVDDSRRVAIVHARTATTLTDMQKGQIIFLLADSKSLEAGNIIPNAFVISEK